MTPTPWRPCGPPRVVVSDPRSGEVRGHKRLREFVSRSQFLLTERHARTETVASTVVGGRAVVELLVHLVGDKGEVAWPVAVVAESPDDRSVVFRNYFSQLPVLGRRDVRPPILEPGRPASCSPSLRRCRSTGRQVLKLGLAREAQNSECLFRCHAAVNARA